MWTWIAFAVLFAALATNEALAIRDKRRLHRLQPEWFSGPSWLDIVSATLLGLMSAASVAQAIAHAVAP